MELNPLALAQFKNQSWRIQVNPQLNQNQLDLNLKTNPLQSSWIQLNLVESINQSRRIQTNPIESESIKSEPENQSTRIQLGGSRDDPLTNLDESKPIQLNPN